MGFIGKTLASCWNLYSFPTESNQRIAAIQIFETVKITKMIHAFLHMDAMCVMFTVCFIETILYFNGKHKSFKFSLYSSNDSERKQNQKLKYKTNNNNK